MAPRVQMVTYATLGARRMSFESSSIIPETSRAKVTAGVGSLESMVEKGLLGLMSVTGKWTMHYTPELMRFDLDDLIADRRRPALLTTGNGDIGTGCIIWQNGWDSLKGFGSAERGSLKTIEGSQDGTAEIVPGFGLVLWNTFRAGAKISATGNSTPIVLPALAAGYVATILLVVGASPDGIEGTPPTTITVKLQSDTSGFASPIDRHTFAVVGDDPAYELVTIDGNTTPVTDTNWRLSVSGITGTGAAYDILAGMAIMPKVT